MRNKIAIIGGAGNVGVTTALRIVDSHLADCLLLDIEKNLAEARKLDLEDSVAILKKDSKIYSSDDFSLVKNCNIIVITAGLARRPGMTREDLLKKNANIIKEVCTKIKPFLNDSKIVIIVTNPLDITTYIAYKQLNISRFRLFGMGGTLDSGRFNNLIARELNCSSSDIETMVIASHGKDMLPLLRLSTVKNKPLLDIISKEKQQKLIEDTVRRGASIVELAGSGSAYFGPSAAIFNIVAGIITNKTLKTCASCYLEGEYDAEDICIGVPVEINSKGISKIIQLKLSQEEKSFFNAACTNIKNSINELNI